MSEREKEDAGRELTEAELRLMTDDELYDLLNVLQSASPIKEVIAEICKREDGELYRSYADVELDYRPPLRWWHPRSAFRARLAERWQPIRYRLILFRARWRCVRYHGLMPRKIVRWLDARAERRAAK